MHNTNPEINRKTLSNIGLIYRLDKRCKTNRKKLQTENPHTMIESRPSFINFVSFFNFRYFLATSDGWYACQGIHIQHCLLGSLSLLLIQEEIQWIFTTDQKALRQQATPNRQQRNYSKRLGIT